MKVSSRDLTVTSVAAFDTRLCANHIPIDGYIYIWHKENGSLVEKLDAHSPSCCSAVSWNPTNPCMFATGGDDAKVRM